MKETILKKAMKEMGAKGGKSTLQKHGKEHYSEMSKKRWGAKKAQEAGFAPAVYPN